MNDRWPLPAADGIEGPFLKMKKHNGKPTLPTMDASNVCFDTLSHVDSFGYNKDAMQGASGVGLPKEYESTYPYRRGSTFEEFTKIVLIVKDGEARLYYPTPSTDRYTPFNNLRQSQTVTSTWTFDLQGYTGGQVGVFTYSHEATFSNWKITDISDETAISAYCNGNPHLTCDNQRGDASTGLCLAVASPAVCEGPTGPEAKLVNTKRLDIFDFYEDPNLSEACKWELGPDRNLRHASNAFNSNTVVLGCSAIVKNTTYTDFIAQVDIDNDDDDAVGMVFGYQSDDDFFRVFKINDLWPNPAADFLTGPVFKVQRKVKGVSCANGPFDDSNPSCLQTLAFVDSVGGFTDGLDLGAVVPFEYSKKYIKYDHNDVKRFVLIVKDDAVRAMYEDVEMGTVVSVQVLDLTKYDYAGGRVGFFVSGQIATFSNFFLGALSGPEAVTNFCSGGVCDERTGLCMTQPTTFPTLRAGDVAIPDVCPGPVDGLTTTIDTTDENNFRFVDMEPISEPCEWTTSADGLSQNIRAWGNYCGPNGCPSGNYSEHVTIIGCVALIGAETYTDFMLEVTTSHEDEETWGFVFGWDDKQPVTKNYMAMANNDRWPDPAADGVRGPFIKLKKTNDKPCIPIMNTSYNCYDTISYSDSEGNHFANDDFGFAQGFNNNNPGRFNIDGERVTDIPGEYASVYPYDTDERWPDRKMTLIVKDGQARLLLPGPERDFGGLNGFRQPSTYVGTWSYDLGDYTGGQIGFMTYAHRGTFKEVKITDLTDDANLPSAYCDGNPQATCTSGGVCTAVPVSDVCEDPVGAIDVDVTTLTEWDFVADELVTGNCQWETPDLGAGPKLYQSSNAQGGFESLGCNALHKSGSYTDFILQFDADIYDNDALGMVFGWKAPDDHFKVHKRVDWWPSPNADNVQGPAFKVKRRLTGKSCAVLPQNETTNCK